MLSLILSLVPVVAGPPAGGAAVVPEESRRSEPISFLLAPGTPDFEQLAGAPRAAELLAGTRLLRVNRLGVHDLAPAPGADAEQLAARLRELPEVESAWVPGRGTWLEVPDDTEYAQQWQLSNDGSGGGTAGADVAAELAWNTTAGDPDVVIAILDSGVEIAHPDLAPNVWHNAAELANGLDDDGNGLVDDLDGWDFHNDDADVTGPNTHGTRVAGMAGARANDGFGVAGLAGGWDDEAGCRIMVLSVGDGFPDASVVDDAILYAVDHGARVINLSLSITQSVGIDMALADAAANDVLVVAATGNFGSSVTYPADVSTVVAVAATSRDDSTAGFSNSGPEVDLAAPGDGVLSTSGASGTGMGVGTSFASPLVAAAAGLLFSRMPSLSAADARAILVASAVDIDAPGPDSNSGAGRLDAAAALALLEASDCDGNGLYDPAEFAADPSLDLDLNGVLDLCQLGTPLCFGDASGSPVCPCDNSGEVGHGCANSTGGGARLTASGSAVLADDDFLLHVVGARGGQTGVFLQGRTSIALPFKDGILCTGNPTERLEYVVLSAAGQVTSSFDPAAVGQVNPGDTAYYQLWYRDPTLSPCGSGSNLSSAFAVNWL